MFDFLRTQVLLCILIIYSLICYQIEQLNIDKEGLEKERDFYFNKLREIEVICQDNEGMTHIKEIMDVLYATEVCMCLIAILLLFFIYFNRQPHTLIYKIPNVFVGTKSSTN